MAFEPPAPAGDLILRTASRTVAPGAGFEFEIVSASGAPFSGCTLDFPGFVPASHVAAGAAPLPRWSGHLPRPGFHPLRFTAEVAGQWVSGSDYFVVPDAPPVTPDHEAGYYVFLGCGDYPIITGQETHPLAGWTLTQWQELVAWMGAHGMNRLWVLLNGYTLAYPSQRYPELCDRFARNVTDNFLRELIDFGHAHGVKTYLMLTTDGHARDFVHAHPAAARLTLDGQPGIHYGLALEHPATQRYIFGVLDEVLALYPNADGVAVHPTESDPDRFNVETLVAFHADTGGDLRATPKEERYAWYNRTYARFLARFGERCRAHRADLDLVMANCWWQDDYVAINHAELPPAWRIAVWYYTWEDTAPQPWPIYRWAEPFGADRLIYAATSQSYLFPSDPARIMERHLGTDRLVSTAASLGVRDTMYFAGWDILAPDARLLDLALVRHPTLVGPGPDAASLRARLYADYFALRRELVAPR